MANQATMVGRGGYNSMKRHYLSELFAARLCASADQVIDDSFYDGTRHFSFEKYCENLNQAFTDIDSTREHVDETRKIRVLLRHKSLPL
jgi:hypothetical protein